MSESTTVMSALCRRCGHAAPGMPIGCPHCGSPLDAAAGPAVLGGPAPRPMPVPTAHAPAAGAAAHRFEPARIESGPRLGRRGWLAVGVSTGVVVLAVAAYLVLRPTPPSPAGTVRDYFADLGRGDTAAALALVDTGGGSFSPDSAPLLVPAALASAANRPTGATVTSSRTVAGGEGRNFTVVAVAYKVGGHPVEQPFVVAATGDKKTPYRLEQPFLYLTVEAPDGLAAKVNGVAVDADMLAQGTPAFPGAYQATTTGNALFAGATQSATYRTGGNGVAADIQFGQPALAADAPQTVQAAAARLLDTNCLNLPVGSDGYQCPMRAPYDSYDQTTTWKITSYPQVELSSASTGQSGVVFTTGTPGSATYTITYTDFDGTTHSDSGTVPIDIHGYAGIGDGGAIQLELGY